MSRAERRPRVKVVAQRLERRRGLLLQDAEEGLEGHRLEVLAAVAARRDALRLDLPLPDDERERDLGELRVADLGTELVGRLVELCPEALRREVLRHRPAPLVEAI